MSGQGAAFAAAARGFIGTPFRLRGRDAATGLDCVGLVFASLRAIGRTPPAPAPYTLRQLEIDHLLALLPHAGFAPAEHPGRQGDLLLAKPAPGQFHLAIAATGSTFVHAHAGLGRVVECPAPLPWPIAGHWRLT